MTRPALWAVCFSSLFAGVFDNALKLKRRAILFSKPLSRFEKRSKAKHSADKKKPMLFIKLQKLSKLFQESLPLQCFVQSFYESKGVAGLFEIWSFFKLRIGLKPLLLLHHSSRVSCSI